MPDRNEEGCELKRGPEKDQWRLYSDLAWTWPIISPPEDYIEETVFFSQKIAEYAQIDAKTLLHLGCGGGHNDYTFKRYFKLTGVDLSESMLNLAKNLNPEVTYRQGDMRTVRLGRSFDTVVCLDSINYMTTEEDLRSVFITAYEHLTQGGVFLTIIEDISYMGSNNYCRCTARAHGDVDLAFIENYYHPDPGETTYEATFVYLIRKNGVLDIQTDHHLCGIFKFEKWLDLLTDVGFEVHQEKLASPELNSVGYLPVLIGIKR